MATRLIMVRVISVIGKKQSSSHPRSTTFVIHLLKLESQLLKSLELTTLGNNAISSLNGDHVYHVLNAPRTKLIASLDNVTHLIAKFSRCHLMNQFVKYFLLRVVRPMDLQFIAMECRTSRGYPYMLMKPQMRLSNVVSPLSSSEVELS